MTIPREILLAQLGFDLLMLLALLILVRYVLRAEAVVRPAREPNAASTTPRSARPRPSGTPVAAALPGLEDLVGAAERQEYAAEAALRARLGRFKERAAH